MLHLCRNLQRGSCGVEGKMQSVDSSAHIGGGRDNHGTRG